MKTSAADQDSWEAEAARVSRRAHDTTSHPRGGTAVVPVPVALAHCVCTRMHGAEQAPTHDRGM
jgi:hypothetical protein